MGKRKFKTTAGMKKILALSLCLFIFLAYNKPVSAQLIEKCDKCANGYIYRTNMTEDRKYAGSAECIHGTGGTDFYTLIMTRYYYNCNSCSNQWVEPYDRVVITCGG